MNLRTFFLTIGMIAWLAGCAYSPERSAKKTDAAPEKPLVRESTHIEEETEPDTPLPPSEEMDEPAQEETDVVESVFSPEKPDISAEDREKLVNQFLKAAILEEKNQYEEAGEAYAKALEIVPDSPFLGAMTGKALLQSGKIDEAIQIAREAIQHGTNEIEAYKVLGLAYRQKKDLEKAIEQYEKLVEIQPNSPDNLNELVSLYVRNNRFEEAIDIYRQLAHLDVYQSFIYHYRIALLQTQLGRYQEALDEYKIVSEEVPNNFDILYRMGKLYEILNKNDDAIITYLSALQHIRNDNDEHGVRSALAALYSDRNSHQEAIHQYNRIKELNPDDAQAAYQLAVLYFKQENYLKTIEEINALIEKNPGIYFFEILRLQAFQNLNRSEEGIQFFLAGLEQAIAQENWEEVQRFLVELTRKSTLADIQKHNKSPFMQTLLEKSIQTFPDQPRVFFVSAKIALLNQNQEAQNARFEEILTFFTQALEKKEEERLSKASSELRSWYDVRREIANSRFSEDLIAALHACIEQYPKNPDLHRTLAHVYMDQNRWTDAETHLLLAKETLPVSSPSYRDLVYQLATVYDKMERLADIEELMNETIEQFPDDSQAYNFLGYTYADRNIRLDEAVQLIQKALRLNPNDGNIMDSMGWAYYRMGRIQDAIAYLEKAITREENHPVILDHLGDAKQQQGDIESAIRCWKQALEYGPDFPYDFTPEFQRNVLEKIQEAEKNQLP
ncbi:MAG: tetratricopeptide repeat protein [Candidatus Omnitrophica bacterium]|nr:tetratricopeptide repeat protein [Candidatus Omnitrophota bacterium]